MGFVIQRHFSSGQATSEDLRAGFIYGDETGFLANMREVLCETECERMQLKQCRPGQIHRDRLGREYQDVLFMGMVVGTVLVVPSTDT